MLTGACGAKHGCEETKPLSSGLLRGLWGPVLEASIFSPHFCSTLCLLVNIPCGGQAALEVNLAEWRVHAALSVPRVVTWCFRRPAASCWYEVGKAPASLRFFYRLELWPGVTLSCCILDSIWFDNATRFHQCSSMLAGVRPTSQKLLWKLPMLALLILERGSAVRHISHFNTVQFVGSLR